MTSQELEAIGLQIKPLVWSEISPPQSGVSYYDHTYTDTPFGRITLEWKSWKEYDEPGTVMPWGEFVHGRDIVEAKANVEAAIARCIAAMLEVKL